MKFSGLFGIYRGESDLAEGTSFIALREFLTFLKSRDVNNKILAANVKRTLASYPSGIKTVNGEQAVPVASVLRFCFHCADSVEACKFVSNIVVHELLCRKEVEGVSSSFELYKLIAKAQFQNTEIPCENIVFDEHGIETLVIEHKEYFTSEEWNKICWFENQFSSSLAENASQQDFEKIIALKYAKFQSILSFNECCDKWLKIAESDIKERQQRIICAEEIGTIYCPKRHQTRKLSYQDVRALTIGKKEDKSFKGGYRTNDPRNWLPPESAIQRLGELVQLQIKYMETVGKHDAVNPDFLQYSVLQRNASDEIIYDFGPESHFTTFEELPVTVQELISTNTSNKQPKSHAEKRAGKRPEKRQLESMPQKGLRRKRPLTSTPKSSKQ